MDNIVVADKATAQVTAQQFGDVSLPNPAVVQIPVPPDQVASVTRSGDDAVLNLKNGEHVRVSNFFKANAEGVRSDMVFQDENGTLWQAQYNAEAFHGFTFAQVSSLDDLLAGVGVVGSATPEWAIAGLGLLGAGGATAAAVGGGGGGSSDSGTAADTTAPDSPTGLSLSGNGLVLSGLGEIGSTVTVRDAAGNVLGSGTVGSDGSFQVSLSNPQTNGQTLDVTLTDAAGNVSAPGTVTAADTSAPDAPGNLAVSADGSQLTGTAEAGSTVTVRAADGSVLGTAVAAADGTFTLTLSQPQANGQTLTVNATDAAGNASVAGTVTAADTTAPDAPGNLAVSADGSQLTGTAEAGSTVTVRAADGSVLGTAVAAADGTFTLTLSQPQANGQTLTVNATDAAGNASVSGTVTAADTTAPDAPGNLAVSADGSQLTGTAEAGSTVTVRAADGSVLGTAVAAADGTFTLTLSPAQTDGQTLNISATDAAGNTSSPATTVAPDIGNPDTTPPDAPTDVAISGSGTLVSGHGEAGSTATIIDANGTVLGSAVVGADGLFSISISPAQDNGQVLQVTLTDAAGNVSANVALTAPDIQPPAQPANLVLSADGLTLTGTTEPGARVLVHDANGQVIGAARAAQDGTFSLTLDSAQTNGEHLDVTATDAAGNSSAPVALQAGDTTAPDPVTNVVISADGIALSGQGEVGATVSITNAAGTVIGTGTVGANGTFEVTLAPGVTQGDTVRVVQADAQGNTSPAITVLAPDADGPGTPSALVVNADGSLVTGSATAGNLVEVRDGSGNLLGSAVVASNGEFTITLTPAQANGEVLDVTAIDGNGESSVTVPVTAPDITGPTAATDLVVNANGLLLTGRGEVGATVSVTDANGNVLGTAVVSASGSFAVTLASAQVDGQALQVTLTDAAGNPSPATAITAPDLDGPLQPGGLALNVAGTVLTGNGEAGAHITVTDANGNALGTAIVAADGTFSVTLSSAQNNGQTLLVAATDAVGNGAGPVTFIAPDTLAPNAATDLAVNASGNVLTGSGEIGATVTVRDPSGTVLGTATVDGTGHFSVTLAPAQIDAEALQVVLADAAGNPSTPAQVTAPDLVAPSGLTSVDISANGTLVSGHGEVGATVTVRDADGNSIGSAVVGSNGTFEVTLSPAQINGQALTALQTDAAGNASPGTDLTAPDIQAPDAPANLTLNGAGDALSGTGEPGATVHVYSRDGTLLGSDIVSTGGTFTVALNSAQADGQVLRVNQSDASNNTSADASLTAADNTPPAQVGSLAISGNGATVTGTGEAGDTVYVRASDGTLLGSAVVAGNGTFTVTLTPAQLNGEVLSVNQLDTAQNPSAVTTVTAPDLTAPAAPTDLAVSTDGLTVTGTAEANSSIQVRAADGTLLGEASADGNGVFSVILNTAQTNAQPLQVTATDASNNTSLPGAVSAPDTTAPQDVTNLAVSPDGTQVSGTGEAGSTVTVREGSTVLGSGTVGSDGVFVITLTTAASNGSTLSVVSTDAANNSSNPVDVAGPDGTQVAAPSDLALSSDGTTLTGAGTAGSTITVVDSAGTNLGTTTVNSLGRFSIRFATAQLNAQVLHVTATDSANHTSVPSTVVASDSTAPDAPTDVAVNSTGTTLTGKGEVGATVTALDSAGTVLGTATVASNGTFVITLTPTQADAQALTVTQADPAGNVSQPASTVAPDLTAPDAATGLAINNVGTVVNGQGEAGATVTVTNAAGAVVGTGTVDQSGNFQITVAPAQTDGGTLHVSLTDAAGNISADATVATVDTTPPAAVANLAISSDGATLNGTGEVGATVRVTDSSGVLLGTATVAANGTFSVALAPAPNNGQTLDIYQTDAAGNASPSATLTAPDITPPAALTQVAVNADGITVTGHGEPNATVSVRSADGTLLGTGLVASNGAFTLTLNTPQLNAQVLTVTQEDPPGNVSTAVTVTAQDLTPPDSPTDLALNSAGLQLTGHAEAGSTVTVSNAQGAVLGTAIAAANGTFQLTLGSAQTNGQALSVTATDAAGNVSTAASYTAADTTAPLAVTNLAVAADGATVAGQGEVGATVTVRDASGTLLGTGTVASNGSFSLTLAPAAAAGSTLSVVQTDAAGNASGAANVTAPGSLAEPAPTNLVLSADGLSLTGNATAGSSVSVHNAAGTVLGTAQVASDGTFSITLTSAQLNGEQLSATATSSDGINSLPTGLIAADVTAPTALSDLHLAANGTALTGHGEAGATVTVLGQGGIELGTAVVGANGTFSVTLNAAQTNGQLLSLSQTDAAGNESPSVNLTAPDLIAPDAPTGLTVSSNGLLLSGTGEAGTTVKVVNAAGDLLGTGTVNVDGSFQITLNTPQANGQQLAVTLTDAAGNTSAATDLTSVDTTAPSALTQLAIASDGATLTGHGEAGAIVTVSDSLGVPLGTATVGTTGTFTLVLATPLTNAEVLTLVQADASGNVSPTATLTTPDFTAPDPLADVAINAAGALVTGTGEAGATVIVKDPAGLVLGTAVVLADGTFSVSLSTPQINGQALTVQQADPPGNVSTPVVVNAPDLTPPDLATQLQFNASGTVLSGVGEAGTAVRIILADNTEVGTGTVDSTGHFLITLDTAQTNGQTVWVTLTDAAGNTSATATQVAPDITAPAAVTGLALDATGLVLSGAGEAGASVTVTNAAGTTLGTGTVDANGQFTLTLSAAQLNGEQLSVVQQDAAGNPSVTANLVASDVTAPTAPTVTALSADGLTLTGTGEAGATLVVTTATGGVLATVTVATDGTFSTPLSSAQVNGQLLTLVQTDTAGNHSLPLVYQAGDTTAPADVTALAVSPSGLTVTGLGEANATVTVRSAAGVELGTTTVAADGHFSVGLSSAQLNGETLTVSQTDVAGNLSGNQTVTASDITAPAAPTVTSLSVDGVTLTGTAEANSLVTVRSVDGTELGTATATAGGIYTVTLAPAQINGQVLSIVAADASSNASTPLIYTTLDTQAPDAVTNLSISADHSLLAGRGEVGATVLVTDADGTTVGSGVVAANGTFVINLSAGIDANAVLTVVQTDASNNTSVSADLIVPVAPAPDAPTDVVLAADGVTLNGVAAAGTTITVYSATGTVLGTGTTGSNGIFDLTLTTPQTNGQTLSVTASTQAGGASLPTELIAADTTAPDPLTGLAVTGAGLLVTGHGEVGATVTITSATGALLGTGVVGVGGTFSVNLNAAQTNGQVLTAVQTDAYANTSTSVTVQAADTTAPVAPSVLALDAAGLVLSGLGETGATVTVTNAAGTVLGTGTVVGGTFAVTLSAAQLNGQTLTVSQADAAGNVSAGTTLVANDTTAPAQLANLALTSSGLQVTGTGEAGATVTVTSATGTVLGTTQVGSAGTFTVTLGTAQLNGQVLTLVQTDAAGNASLASTLTALDTQAPTAPGALALAVNGITLTGTGEAGATVTVSNGGTTLGTAVVGLGGTFTVTLSSAQLDGQVLTVRQTDVAGNASATASLTAPDTTAPAAPTGVLVNASGTLVTGTGVAGSTVTVRAGTSVLGTTTVAANGSFSVALTTAQINSQVLSVTQADPSGNVSTAATTIAPDLTPPAAAGTLLVSADGLTVSGTGEANSIVTIKAASGLVLGTGTVGGTGVFSVVLSAAQINGETLSVSLTDANGNVSTAVTVTAPDLDANAPVTASNDLAVATVNLTPVSTTTHYTDSFTTLLAGFSKTYTFTVGSGTSVTSSMTLTAGSLVSLLTGVSYTLQVKDASGNWVTLDVNGSRGILDLLTINSQEVQVNISALLSGDYRLVVSSSGIGVLTTVTTDVTQQTSSLTQFTGSAGVATTGNVLTDLGTNGLADQLGPDSAAVLQISKNGTFVTAASGAGTTVQGLYGTLVIHADGSYTYTANGSTSSIGQVDTFTYQLVHANGLSATATLYVRIESPQSTETWSSTNLAAAATVVDATYDIASTSITLAAKEVTSTATLGTLSVPLLGGANATYTTSVAANTVSDLTVTLNASNLLSLASSLTLGLYKLNTSTGQYVLVKSVSGGALLSLGGNNYGVTFDDQTSGTYQVKVVVTGIGLASSITTSITNVATYTNQYVVGSYTPVVGNLLTDTAGGGADILGSAYTVLSVLLAGSYVTPGYNGTTIAGTYGSLLVHADGSYTYTLNAGLTDAAIGHSDVFTYELTHPNGTTDISTLTIDLTQAGATASTFSALALVSDETSTATTTAAAASTSTEVLQGTDGNDTLDAIHGGAVTIIGGAGNDTMIVHDQNFASVDGGTGTDTLMWDGGDATIDLGTLASRIHNIEILDLNSTSAVALTLNLADMLAVIESGDSKLIIKGNSQDSVHMTDTWTASGTETADGVSYTQYTPEQDPSHHLWVQSGVHVV